MGNWKRKRAIGRRETEAEKEGKKRDRIWETPRMKKEKKSGNKRE